MERLRVLRVIEPGVGAALCQKLLMRALLLDAAVRDDQNAAGLPDGGQAVGDDERRAVLCQLVKGVLDLGLGQTVERRGRLVEDQDRRVFRKIRAMEMRCFWPPDRSVPRSPT